VAFDLADPGFLADPYPVFAELRSRGAVHRHDGIGFPVAVSHAACSEVLRHRRLGRVWSDATPVERFASFNLLHRNSLLENEPPTHTRLRRLVSAAFARGHVERLRDSVAALSAALVDDMAGTIASGGTADVIADLAAPLPVRVIADLLGVPAEEEHLLVPWSNAIVKMYEYGLPESGRRAAEQAAGEFVAYLRGLAEARRSAPRSDLISDLVSVADADGDTLGSDELVGTAALLLMAGHEATVNVIGNGVLALMRDRVQWDRLVAAPALVSTAVDELIRYDSPLQLFERTALAEVPIAGVTVPEGGKIGALLGAAARDPEVFDAPDRLDLWRSPNHHLGFGAGVHYCLGAPLARMEIAAALQALVHRLPTLGLAAEPERRPEFVIRGLRTLPVSA
jgi:cytochrome P450